MGRRQAATDERQLMAGSVSSRALLRADMGPPDPGIQDQLPGAASYEHRRPAFDARGGER